MKPDGHQTMRLKTDGASAVRQAGRRSKASVDDDRGVIEAALATTRFTAKEVSDRRWADFVENGPIGFRSGTVPEVKLGVEHGVSVSHESRETVNQTKQISLAHNQETHNYKPNNCKQIKRNSVELAKSHRLFTVENKEKTRRLLSQETEGMNKLSSDAPEREQTNTNKVVGKVPSKVGRTPIKLIGTDIEGNNLELSFHMEGDPIAIYKTQVNSNKRKGTSISVNSRTLPYIHVNPRKSP